MASFPTTKGMLDGALIMVLEDEWIIAHDVKHELEAAGARVVEADTLEKGLEVLEMHPLTAAVLDFGNSSNPVCERCLDRKVPYVLYTGYHARVADKSAAAHISKPAEMGVLVTALSGAIFPARLPSA